MIHLSEYIELYNSVSKLTIAKEKYIKNNFTNIYDEINSIEGNYSFSAKSYIYRTGILPICGNVGCENIPKYINITKGFRKACSNSCSAILSTDKRKETMLDIHGVEHALQSEKIRRKFKKTSNERYDHDNPAKSDIVKKRTEMYFIDTYGYKSPFNVPSIIEKINKTIEDKYDNETYFGSDDSKIKNKNTFNLKYDVDYVHEIKRTDEEKQLIKEKRRKTQDDKWYNSISKYYEVIDYWDYPKKVKIRCEKGHDYIITNNMLRQREALSVEVCTECNKIDNLDSFGENELLSYIESIYNGEIISNDRTILSGKELDIYLPELNVAFEYNGIYWHSDLYKDKNYHMEKTDKCLAKGIRLIHVFEDDWLNKKDIIKSIIYGIISNDIDTLDSSVCDVRIIKNSDLVVDFMNENNLDVYSEYTVALGLYYNSECVSMMTFIELDNEIYELSTFCSNKYLNVIGGNIKMFRFFIDKFSFNKIISYCDRSIFDGLSYIELGMNEVCKTEPNFSYFDSKYNKVNILTESTDFDDYYRIYDSGDLIFNYNKSSNL